MKLNAKHKLFIACYVAQRSGVRAVMAAKLTRNERSASVIASRLLANVSIRDAINKELRRQMDRIELNSDDVLKKINSIMHDPDSKRFEILKAGELLGKHFKLFTEVVETTGKDGGPQVILTLPANGSEADKVAPDKPTKKGEK